MPSSDVVTMPPTIGAAIRGHQLRAGTAAPHDRKQACHDDGNGHCLRPHKKHSPFADVRKQGRIALWLASV